MAFLQQKCANFGPEVKFDKILAIFWSLLQIFSLILTILAFLTLIMTKNRNFSENWSTNMLYTSKESKNHVEIDFITKKYDLCKKKTQKWEFFDFWPKNEAD